MLLYLLELSINPQYHQMIIFAVAGRETVLSKALNIGWREHPDPKPDTRYTDSAAITKLDGFGSSPTRCSSM